MIYSLLGVPINGIFIGSLGAYFRNKLKRFISEKQEKHENDLTYFVVLVFQVMVYLVFGLVLFILTAHVTPESLKLLLQLASFSTLAASLS